MIYDFKIYKIAILYKYYIVFVILLIFAPFYTRYQGIPHEYLPIVFFPLIAFFVIPGIVLTINYYKNSKGKRLEVGWQELVYDSGGIKRQINKEEIESIHKLTSRMSEDAFEMAFTPWGAGIYYCYIIRLHTGEHIIIPNLLDDSEESLEEQLSRFTDEIKTIRRMWPWIPTEASHGTA